MKRLTKITIGDWYKSSIFDEYFEVVARDEDLVEIQFFNGEIEEIDLETWLDLRPKKIATPEDWTGAYEMTSEDLEGYFDETIHPKEWNPLTPIESEHLY